MILIPRPVTLAERLVNAVVGDIYSRAGGGWLDLIDRDVLENEVIPELVATVQFVLDDEAKREMSS